MVQLRTLDHVATRVVVAAMAAVAAIALAGCGGGTSSTDVTSTSVTNTTTMAAPTLPIDPCSSDYYQYGCPGYEMTTTTLSLGFCQDNLSSECDQQYGPSYQACVTWQGGGGMCYWTRQALPSTEAQQYADLPSCSSFADPYSPPENCQRQP